MLGNPIRGTGPCSLWYMEIWKSFFFCDSKTMTGNHAKRELACLQSRAWGTIGCTKAVSLLLLAEIETPQKNDYKLGVANPSISALLVASADGGTDLPLRHLLSDSLGTGTLYEIENDAIVAALHTCIRGALGAAEETCR